MAWITARVTSRQEWAEGLVTLALDASVPAFVPGQFVNLALELGGELVKRPYSLASAIGAPAEFYLTLLPHGTFTPSLFALDVGAPLLMEDRANGFFTLEHVPPARDAWLIGTGTGLGPFISMLRSPELWQRFEHIVVVHGVRENAHLGYRGELSKLVAAQPGKLRYVPVVSREAPGPAALAGRVTTQLESGGLEAHAGLPIGADHSHVLLCGNPDMIDEMELLLEARGLRRHRKRNPGHYTIERYW